MGRKRAKHVDPSLRVPTSKKLATALTAAGAPDEMITRAEEAYYDDYKSPLATPCLQLVIDCEAIGTPELKMIAAHARDGIFDGQQWEAEAWAKSPEGQETFQLLVNRGRHGQTR